MRELRDVEDELLDACKHQRRDQVVELCYEFVDLWCDDPAASSVPMGREIDDVVRAVNAGDDVHDIINAAAGLCKRIDRIRFAESTGAQRITPDDAPVIDYVDPFDEDEREELDQES
jgi:hypothetical protein